MGNDMSILRFICNLNFTRTPDTITDCATHELIHTLEKCADRISVYRIYSFHYVVLFEDVEKSPVLSMGVYVERNDAGKLDGQPILISCPDKSLLSYCKTMSSSSSSKNEHTSTKKKNALVASLKSKHFFVSSDIVTNKQGLVEFIQTCLIETRSERQEERVTQTPLCLWQLRNARYRLSSLTKRSGMSTGYINCRNVALNLFDLATNNHMNVSDIFGYFQDTDTD